LARLHLRNEAGVIHMTAYLELFSLGPDEQAVINKISSAFDDYEAQTKSMEIIGAKPGEAA
jgi:hypothetical protein